VIKTIYAGTVELGPDRLFLIAGPCAIEAQAVLDEIAGELKEVCARLGIPFVFKASFDKANRTSIKGPRGPGLLKGLEALGALKARYDVPILTDVHEPSQAAQVAAVSDILQIPAFLCRQTDLIVAAAETGAPLNIKKGQFMAPWDMRAILGKAESAGNTSLMLTERGTTFGYNNLVADMRSIPIMREFGYPVVFDATHSVQRPGGLGTASGGDGALAPALARAAVAAGADGLFIETHPRPEKALSDGPNMIPLSNMPALLEQCKRIREILVEGGE
jgi:2-dehydro-3-deoxyphosphooctonate aldolase (KDO 8-P synthase)